ncbi:hypothetical protein MMC22_004636 [Lobaria immixta]|nr:hypothetical protein [Lobaria immixta]
MSRFTPINIPQENNLPLVIHFTRTSPTFSRQARIEALQGLVNRCSRAIESCLEAIDEALATIEQGDKHRTSLNDIRAEMPADLHRGLSQMTEDVQMRTREDVEAIGRSLRTLIDCKRGAEQGLAEARRAA